MSEAFDSEDAHSMARALSLAVERIAPTFKGDLSEARSILARAIIEAAENGERDAEKLAAHAVAEFGKTQGDGTSIN